MATALPALDKSNLENYTLIWLDQDANAAAENIQAQPHFRSAINYLKMFKKSDECTKYIQSLTKDDCVVMIASGRLGQEIIPEIHPLPQVRAIYVYCFNKAKYEPWAKQFSKISRILTDLPNLTNTVGEDQIQRQHTRIHEPFPLHILQPKTSLDQTDTSFLYIDVLIKCLMETNSTTTDKTELLAICRKQYVGNESELKLIEEFDQNYFPSRAVWWYTRPAFFSRILNRALQIQDMNILLRLSFFLRDMERQLEKNRSPAKVHVFCGRFMSREDLEYLKNNQGGFLVINTFLSTTTKEQVKTFFDQTAFPIDFERVIFEIEADPNLANVKPFGQIKALSYLNTEEQTLFMLGSIFRVDHLRRGGEGMCLVQMTLCSENDPNIRSIHEQYKTEHPISFGRIFCEVKRFDVAEQYYHRLLDDLPAEHKDTALLYDALGDLETEKGNDACSQEYFNKAFDIRRKILPADDPSLGDSYFNLGKIHRKKKEIKHGLDAFNKAIEIYSKHLNGDHPKIAACMNGLGDMHMQDKKYSKALDYYEKTLQIRRKSLADVHRLIGDSHQNIARAHRSLNNLDQAMAHYTRALDVYKKNTSPPQLVIGMVLKSLAEIYEEKKKFANAIAYYEEALAYVQRVLPSTDRRVVEIENGIQRVKEKLK